MTQPYPDPSTNLIYNLLFCDDLELYRSNTTTPGDYPFDILFGTGSPASALMKIADDHKIDPRLRVLAWNRLRATGATIDRKDLLGVIVEVSMEEGLDTLAAFMDGTARYINHSGKIIVWETPTEESDQLIAELLSGSLDIIKKIGPWDQPRRPAPENGNVRITFLVSDGLYFGEGPIDVLFDDPMAGPALNAATQLLSFITEAGLAN